MHCPFLPSARHMVLARTLEQTKQDLPRKYISGFHLISALGHKTERCFISDRD